MKTILITGSDGFIGSHLVKKLKKMRKYRLILVDKKYNKSVITKKIVILKGDVSEKKTIDKIMTLSKNKIDMVIHLAARIYGKRLEQFYKDNVVGTRNIIKLCKKVECKKMIFTSTDFVEVKMRQNYYRVTKTINEKEITKSRINFTILRLSPVFGINDEKNFGKLFSLIKKLPIIIIPRCLINPVDIDHVVNKIIELLELKNTNHLIKICGRFVLFKDIILKLSNNINKRIIVVELPIIFLKPFVFFQEKILSKPIVYYYQLSRWEANRKRLK